MPIKVLCGRARSTASAFLWAMALSFPTHSPLRYCRPAVAVSRPEGAVSAKLAVLILSPDAEASTLSYTHNGALRRLHWAYNSTEVEN